MKKRFLSKKGKHPPIEQEEQTAGSRRQEAEAGIRSRKQKQGSEAGSRKQEAGSRRQEEQMGRAGQTDLQADGQGRRHGRAVRIATFVFHWKLFPSFSTVRIEYQSKNNNINL